MKIGDMKHRITFQKVINSVNENGFETELLEDIKTVWASVTNLQGREFYAAAQVNKENTVKFTIRYLSLIDQTMRIQFQGRTYNITAIDNINYQNKYIEVKAVEINTDGSD